MVADMKVDMVADMVAGMVADMADGVVADMTVNDFFLSFLAEEKKSWLTWTWTWWPTRRQTIWPTWGLVTGVGQLGPNFFDPNRLACLLSWVLSFLLQL